MNKIKRAIIMAAGFGNRMQPITLNTPKPLIKVNGKRMIDTIVEALYENSIFEIYVVVGYKKEQFYEWSKDKPYIKFVENNFYDKCNNISSLYVARDFIEESIILDGDQIIYNSNILNANITKSGYSCVWTSEETDEWLMSVDENNKVLSCCRNGGKDGWQLYSISRWTKDDGLRLKEKLEEEFVNKQNTQIYWDDVVMFCYPQDFDLTIYPINKTDTIEIDNYTELCEIDNTYKIENREV
ncbi:MAG: phosphocholine cytidylyltransferase family protein [Treponema sp.]|nr:phosphocholine cytidylyltransferase family protein [Treponema sp.]